jgi:hypothetical protein
MLSGDPAWIRAPKLTKLALRLRDAGVAPDVICEYLVRECRELVAAGHARLHHRPVDVALDGAYGKTQSRRHFPVEPAPLNITISRSRSVNSNRSLA